MEVYRSALRHGVSSDDAVAAATGYLIELELDDDPRRLLRVGFDTIGRLLETVVLETTNGRQIVIHAMPARRAVLDQLL